MGPFEPYSYVVNNPIPFILIGIVLILYVLVKEIIGPVVKSRIFLNGHDRRKDGGESLREVHEKLDRLAKQHEELSKAIAESFQISYKNKISLEELKRLFEDFKNRVYERFRETDRDDRDFDKRIGILEHYNKEGKSK